MIDPLQLEAFQNSLVFGRLEDGTLIEVRGADRVALLHNLCTNDVQGLVAGRGCEAFFTNVQGKTICHALLLATDDAIWISTAAELSESLLSHLDKYIIREDVELLDRTDSFSTHVIAGPSASEFAETQLGHSIEQMLQHGNFEDLKEVRLARVPFAEPLAYFVFAPQADDEEVHARLTAQGGLEIDAELMEFARIQAKFPCSGGDVTIDNLPQEVGRDKVAISFTKGCYLGQETVARIDALGHVNKYLVGIQFDRGNVPPPQTSIIHDGKPVGYVTSSCCSPGALGPIALGYVRREILEKEVDLTSDFGTVTVTQ